MARSIGELEKIIGYSFKDKNILKTALTHSSYSNEHGCKSYERLEFLGDSVLSVIVSKYLFEVLKEVKEGDLSKIRASLVCEEALANVAHEMGLEAFIILGNGEERAGSMNRPSIMSDVFEAVLGAMYIDSGLDECTEYLLKVMKHKLDEGARRKIAKDYKSLLQELVQQKYHEKTKIEYNTVCESGPEHKKFFIIELIINGKKITKGEGGSKKEAEQNAAHKALSEKRNEIL